MVDFSDDQVRRILLEGRFLFTNKELCEKWKLTPYRLRKWSREHEDRGPIWRVEDCVLAALFRGDREPSDLVEWLDYQDHARYTLGEIEAMLASLEERGEAERDGEKWRYVQVDPPYIFGPRTD